MRVLLISHTCQSQTEGQPRADRLARLPGVELCVLVPDRWKRYGQWREAAPPISEAFRYEVGRVRRPWVGPAQTYLHGYPGLKRLVREFEPDVIDLWEEPWSFVSVQAIRVRNRYWPAAKIVSETEQNIDKTLPPPFERFRRYTLRHADFVVGRSREAVEVVRRKGYAGPAAVVPNAVAVELFRPMGRSACRKQLGLDPDASIAGYVGRLVEAKGIADLIEALARQQRPSQLMLIGAGPDEAAFRALADRHGVADRVRFVGPKPLDELPDWMNALDVLVLPSRTTASWKEQFGRVLIEAQACRVPVIGSDSGGIPEVIGASGLVVPERDPAALAAALDRLAGDPDEAGRLGEVGYQQVHDGCTWERVAERMLQIYQQALAGESAGASGAGENPLAASMPVGSQTAL